MSFAKGTESGQVSWEKYLLTFLITFGGFFIGIIVATKLMGRIPKTGRDQWSTAVLAINLLPYVFAIGALLSGVKFILKRKILSVITTRKKFDWQRFFFAFGLWLTLQLIFLVMAKASGAPIVFDLSLGTLFPLLLVSITLLPIQTAFEDIFYRGFLFQGFSRATGKAGISVVLAALIFGLMHAGNPEINVFGYVVLFYYIISGLFLGLLAHFDDGLELGMGYHFANNFFLILILSNTWQAFQTKALFIDYSEPSFSWEMWLPLAVLQPALLYTFYKVYRWKNPLKRMLE